MGTEIILYPSRWGDTEETERKAEAKMFTKWQNMAEEPVYDIHKVEVMRFKAGV